MTTPFEQALSGSWPPAAWSGLRVLVALSGGADSVALLRGLSNLGLERPGRIRAAHYNHQLRGRGADLDEAFCVELCQTLHVPCVVGRDSDPREDTRGVDDSNGSTKSGSESTWRNARYAFLLNTARQCGARFVVTAHTADDQAETILHRVIRGSGLTGLAGIPRTRILADGVTLIRPMLAISRVEVLEFLKSLNQPYREDPSNRDQRFTRNRLRHNLLPLLQDEYNPRVQDSLLRLGSLASELKELLDEMAGSLLTRCLLHAESLQATVARGPLAGIAPMVVREVFKRLWSRQGWSQREMSHEKWCALYDCVCRDETPSRLSLPGRVTVERTPEAVVISRRSNR